MKKIKTSPMFQKSTEEEFQNDVEMFFQKDFRILSTVQRVNRTFWNIQKNIEIHKCEINVYDVNYNTIELVQKWEKLCEFETEFYWVWCVMFKCHEYLD